jgi:hypothetical protein
MDHSKESAAPLADRNALGRTRSNGPMIEQAELYML